MKNPKKHFFKRKNKLLQDNDETDLQQKILDLRQQRKNAISLQDFDMAEEIHQKLNDLTMRTNTDLEVVEQQSYRTALIELIQNYKEKLNYIKNDFHEKELKIRQRINLSFEEKKKEHINQLIQFEREKAETLIQQQMKESPEYKILILQSQHEATNGNYDEARKLQAEAEQKKMEDISKRIYETNQEYEKLSQTLFERQKTSIALLAKKLDDEIATLKEQYNNKKNIILENRKNAIIGLFNSKGRNSPIYEAITVNECVIHNVPVPPIFGITVESKKLLPLIANR